MLLEEVRSPENNDLYRRDISKKQRETKVICLHKNKASLLFQIIFIEKTRLGGMKWWRRNGVVIDLKASRDETAALRDCRGDGVQRAQFRRALPERCPTTNQYNSTTTNDRDKRSDFSVSHLRVDNFYITCARKTSVDTYALSDLLTESGPSRR